MGGEILIQLAAADSLSYSLTVAHSTDVDLKIYSTCFFGTTYLIHFSLSLSLLLAIASEIKLHSKGKTENRNNTFKS